MDHTAKSIDFCSQFENRGFRKILNTVMHDILPIFFTSHEIIIISHSFEKFLLIAEMHYHLLACFFIWSSISIGNTYPKNPTLWKKLFTFHNGQFLAKSSDIVIAHDTAARPEIFSCNITSRVDQSATFLMILWEIEESSLECKNFSHRIF